MPKVNVSIRLVQCQLSDRAIVAFSLHRPANTSKTHRECQNADIARATAAPLPTFTVSAMPQYLYKAIDSHGIQVPGTLVASSRADALQQLAARTLMPLSLAEQHAGGRRGERVSTAAMSAAFSLLADQLEAGVPLLRALQVMSEQSSDPVLRSQLSSMAGEVAEGTPLASTMRTRSRIFSELDASMVQAGEEGGFLEQSLRRVATVRERQDQIRNAILSAIAYPSLLAVVCIIVVTCMLIFFVPRFEPLFESLRAADRLPAATVLLLWLSDGIRIWAIPATVCIFTAILLARTWGNTQHWRLTRDRLLLSMIGIGPLARTVAVARFCHVLGSLLENGVPMLRALEIAGHATGNQVLTEAVARAAENVGAGRSLSEPLSRSGLFTSDVLEMLYVGEQSNRLESVLIRLAEQLEVRAQRRIDLLLKLIEPLLMLVMAVVVGFIVIALLMPVFEGSGLNL